MAAEKYWFPDDPATSELREPMGNLRSFTWPRWQSSSTQCSSVAKCFYTVECHMKHLTSRRRPDPGPESNRSLQVVDGYGRK